MTDSNTNGHSGNRLDGGMRGMTLVEVCVAMVILSTAALGAASLFGVSLHLIVSARGETTATMLAAQKTEQLRSLEWGHLDSGLLQAVSDATTDLSHEPMTSGGHGLTPSPGSTLSLNTAGYVDFLDRHAAWVGTGSTPPPNAVFIRRWNIAQLPSSTDALVLRVLVTTTMRDAQAASGPVRHRLRGEALVATLLTRKVQR